MFVRSIEFIWSMDYDRRKRTQAENNKFSRCSLIAIGVFNKYGGKVALKNENVQ